MFRTFLSCSVLVFLLCGCGERKESDFEAWANSDLPHVLSTTAMIGDVVKRVGEGVIAHTTLITGDTDPHQYELVIGDSEKFTHADVVFYNGLGLEHGASIRAQLEKHKASISLGGYLRENYPEMIIMNDDQIDPHLWMDLSLWKEIVERIAIALTELAPEKSDLIAQNKENTLTAIEKSDGEMIDLLSAIPVKERVLVTSHDAFNYFARRYLAPYPYAANWKTHFMAPEGLSPDASLCIQDIIKVVNFLCENHVHVVFPESNLHPASLKKILHACAQRGHLVVLSKQPLYGDALGKFTYLEAMQHNASTLVHEWNKNREGQ